jgi:anti-anti-sigma factor
MGGAGRQPGTGGRLGVNVNEQSSPAGDDGRVPVIAAPVELDITNCGVLQAELLAASRNGATIVVDMTRTEFADSSGIQVLVRARERAIDGGGELRLAGVQVVVVRLMSVLGIGEMFVMYPTVSAAASAGPSPPARPRCHRTASG